MNADLLEKNMTRYIVLMFCGLLLGGCGGGGGSDSATPNDNIPTQLQPLQLRATPKMAKAGIGPNGTNILDLSTIGGHTDFTVTITNPNIVAVGRPYVAITDDWPYPKGTSSSGGIPPIYFYHTQNTDDCSLFSTMAANSTCKIYATMFWVPNLDDTQIYYTPLDIMYDDLIHPHPDAPNWNNTRVSKCEYATSIEGCKDNSMMLYYKSSKGQMLTVNGMAISLDGSTIFSGNAIASGSPMEQHYLSYINESLIIGSPISTSAVPTIDSSSFLFDIKPTYDGNALFWAVSDDPYVDLTSSKHCFIGIGQCNDKFYSYKGDYTSSGKFTVGLDGSFWVGGHDYFVKHATDVAQIYDKVTDKFIPSNILTEHLYGINPDGVAINMDDSANFTCYRKTSSSYTSYESQPLQNFNSSNYFKMAPIEAYNSVYVAMQIPNLYTVNSQSTEESVSVAMGYYKIHTENGKCEVEPNGEYLTFPSKDSEPSQDIPLLQINKKFVLLYDYSLPYSETMSLDDLLPYGR